LEQLRQQGDQSEGTMGALGCALLAQAFCGLNRGDLTPTVGPLQEGVEILRPFATSAKGSRWSKREYAWLLNVLSFTQPPEQGKATCEKALDVLAGLGALDSDLSDLSATTAWADYADSEAHHLLALGRLDEAERLEKQVQTLAAAVLERRPADIEARADLAYASDVLTLIEASRFHDDAALRLATQSHQTAQDYHRFNPSALEGLNCLGVANYKISALLFREGHVAEALQKARDAIQNDRDTRGNGSAPWAAKLGSAIARWEAQRENHDAATQALQEARHSYEATSVSQRDPLLAELLEAAERQVELAFGEDAHVYTMSKDAVLRLDKLLQRVTADQDRRAALLHLKRQAQEVAAWAALNLRHYDDAETMARALLALQRESESGGWSSEYFPLDQPEDKVWGQVQGKILRRPPT
jgi:hypothetical protein